MDQLLRLPLSLGQQHKNLERTELTLAALLMGDKTLLKHSRSQQMLLHSLHQLLSQMTRFQVPKRVA